MNMNNIAAIFKKQWKDTLKNKTIFIQFVMFPILTLVMSRTIVIAGMPENFFVNLFATMYMGMAPLTSMAAVLAEEKEKNTLRVLLMSNVKPYEYLLGTGSHIWSACMAGAAVICAAGTFRLPERFFFLAVLAVGILASLLVGAAVGVRSKNQMMAASLSVPVMMIFSFLPMLSMFNPDIEKIAKFAYSEQISRMLNQAGSLQPGMEGVCIIGANLILFAGMFVLAYRGCGLESKTPQ